MVKPQLRLMATALVFYTRVPLPLWFEYSSEYLTRATRYLPLIGILVGGVGASIFAIGTWLFSVEIAIVLSMAATIMLTGAFHEDGFADVCDGFGGGWTPQRILEIMKDPRLGSFGVIGIVLLLLLKFLALRELANAWATPALMMWVLVVGHSVSRFMAISTIVTHRYVQEDEQSKVKALAQTMTIGELLVAMGITLIPLLLAGTFTFWLALLPAVVIWWLLGRWFVKRLGGYTGDCLGAVQQMTEVVFYLSVGYFMR